jgi:hypothetical protein
MDSIHMNFESRYNGTCVCTSYYVHVLMLQTLCLYSINTYLVSGSNSHVYMPFNQSTCLQLRTSE